MAGIQPISEMQEKKEKHTVEGFCRDSWPEAKEKPFLQRNSLPQGRLTTTAEEASTKALYCVRHMVHASLMPCLTSCE